MPGINWRKLYNQLLKNFQILIKTDKKELKKTLFNFLALKNILKNNWKIIEKKTIKKTQINNKFKSYVLKKNFFALKKC